MVVAVKEVSGAMPKELWGEYMPLPGDIIIQLGTKDGIPHGMETFYAEKTALEDELRQLYRTAQGAIRLKVKRSRDVIVDLTVYVVAEESCMPKKHYTIRAFCDARHVVVLDECTEDVYTNLQDSTESILKTHAPERMAAKAILFKQRTMELLHDRRFTNNVVSYPWEPKMDASLPAQGSCMIFSILFMPFKDDSSDQFRAVEDTSARAMTWLCASQTSGVPIIFVNIQTELILDTPNRMVQLFDGCDQDSSKSGSILRLTDSGRYMIDSWERLKIEIARGVRLWYAPVAAELPVDLKLDPGQTRYGLNVNRTEEGFCYISAVDNGSACERAGLKSLCESAMNQGKHLVISRVAGKKVTPWMVCPGGSIHCYDPMAIREAMQFANCINGSARIHVMHCDGSIPQLMDGPTGISL
ncbi:hypothetical protein KI387_011528 [Taxus chinensis]|uniref:Uncharacterized protein n=1 Tax=Taxus chinensis TaxID=29808 RepID=A0AA38CG35_TAXCH|nr:hypothetical protein KI387_011528 [Taxus chinensis]